MYLWRCFFNHLLRTSTAGAYCVSGDHMFPSPINPKVKCDSCARSCAPTVPRTGTAGKQLAFKASIHFCKLTLLIPAYPLAKLLIRTAKRARVRAGVKFGPTPTAWERIMFTFNSANWSWKMDQNRYKNTQTKLSVIQFCNKLIIK